MKNLFAAILFSAAFMLVSIEVDAQCAMCKASAETSMESGSTGAAGINKGVLYLFLTPYIVGGTIAFFWWRAKKKADAS
jgi:hypothetical protein